MNKFRFCIKSSRIRIAILGVLLFSLIAPMLFFNSIIPVSTENLPPEQNETDTEIRPIEYPQSSMLSGNPWWNKSFLYRRLINITNPYPSNLINQGVNLTFNYKSLVDAGHMNSSLKDIRIVENGVLRKYYFKKDFPSTNNAAIWFETNISASTTEYDTFLYYGNNSVNIEYSYFIDERFGLHWYPFDDGPGSLVAKDLGTGTIANATLLPLNPTRPKWVTGKLGPYAIEFNSSNYVSASPGSDISTGKVSLSFWVYLKSGSNTAVRKQSAAYLIEFGINEGNVLGSNPQMYVSTPGGNYYIWWPTAIAYNRWYHIVGTYDATQAKMYINGANVIVTVRGGSASGPMIDSTGLFQIGSWPGETFVGIIDDARIYNYDLSSEEIQWIYGFNRTLSLKLNEEQQVNASVKVIAKDLYANLIPYVNISIYNKSILLQTKKAGIDGSVTFENLKMGAYNFSVKIKSSVNPAIWELVNITSTPFLLNKVSNEVILVCNVSTHTFTVKDADGAPVESGWIVVGNTTSGFGEIQNCTINDIGQAKFWWVKCTPYRYNYTVYYRNDNYNPKVIKLANGTITTPNIPITVSTNLTTVNFTVLAYFPPTTLDPVSGAKLILRKSNATGVSIVNLTTVNGKAILRWVNSSSLTPGININYSLQIDFYGLKRFNRTTGEWPPTLYEFNFSAKTKCTYELRINVNPSDYQTELISLNPSDPIQIKWGSLLTIRYLFNISKGGAQLGPTYADSMTYQVKYGTVELLSGSLSRELGNIGRHQATIDTRGLEGGKSYSIEISAQKSGYSSPIPKSIGLVVLKNDIQLNQSENNDAAKTVYWQENTNMTVKPYGQISESMVVRDSIFKQNNSNDYNFALWIPDLSSNWNLSQITFNIYNIDWKANVDPTDINITFIDPYNKFWMCHVTNVTSAFGGTFSYFGLKVERITLNMNKGSPTQNNNFRFVIGGSFDGTVDIVATASFIRNKINVEYSKYNMTNSISILSDFNGWVIKNITIEISNCRDSSWNLVNPANYIDNITTNDGRVYDYITGDSSGNGRININDTIIYPFNYQYLFAIGNNSKITFDARIKVEYIQGFYQNNLLEHLNLSINRQDYVKGGNFDVTVDDNSWEDQGVTLIITDLKNYTTNFVPSQVGLRINVNGGSTYYFDDFGSLTLSGLSKDTPLSAIIRANQKVTFNLFLAITYSRDLLYDTLGTVTYQIREAPDITGTVQYYPVSDYYLQTINTSLINVGEYTIRFTVSKGNYFSATKDLKLNVLNRLTKINGSTQFFKITSNIYVKDSVEYIFKYTDAANGAFITNLKTQDYIWEQYDDEGNAIDNGTGALTTTSNNFYLLDMNISDLEVGEYLIVVTLGKENYDSKNAMISLTVNKRLIGLSINNNSIRINVDKGSTAIIEFDLIDSTRGHGPLTGATVLLTISGQVFRFKETEPGHYKCELSTDDYFTFFIPLTITGNISISKEDYISEKLSVTIVIGMDIWPIPGFPAFYFLMIVIGIVAVVGSLATYRYIQLTQIPTFVKKARAMKKAIKGSELISESLLYPSKEEFTVKKYGDKWEFLGISLESVLGIERKKMEMTPEIKETPKPFLGKMMRNLYDTIKEKVKKIEFKKKKDDQKGGEE